MDVRLDGMIAPPALPDPATSRPVFWFHLASPATYLVAEQVDRLLADVVWAPVLGFGLPRRQITATGTRDFEARARALGLPLIWPDGPPDRLLVRAMRLATVACDAGRGAEAVLAATRLAYCGGFDLDEDDVLWEVGAAACLDHDVVLAALDDDSLDARLEQTAAVVVEAGIHRLPTVTVAGRAFPAEHQLDDAVATARRLRAPHS